MEKFLGNTKWMLRITDDKSVEEIEKYIKTLEPNKYIIGSELSVKGKRHFHIYLEGVYTKEQLKKSINEQGYKGVQQYNLKQADDSNKVKRYCIKDGDFVHYGIDTNLMEAWKSLAHKKVKDGYKEALTVLEEKYMLGNMYTINQFGTDVIMLQNSYGLKSKRNLHVPYINYMRIKKEGRKFAYSLNSEWMQGN